VDIVENSIMVPGITIKAYDDLIDCNTAQWYSAYQHNAPINLMPHYNRYGLRWGKVAFD